ncbi:MAG: hypothetical protein ACLFQK_01655, partial [Fibrobacterota bacterium]
LIYPEAGRSYSGKLGEAKTGSIFKAACREACGRVSIVPVSISYSIVPEDADLAKSSFTGKKMPHTSLFDDFSRGNSLYGSFSPEYKCNTSFPMVNEYLSKKAPVFCVTGDPVLISGNTDISLSQCFGNVKKNIPVLPHYLLCRMLIEDGRAVRGAFSSSGTEGLGRLFREKAAMYEGFNFDEAFFDEAGSIDMASIAKSLLICRGIINEDLELSQPDTAVFYSNKLPE